MVYNYFKTRHHVKIDFSTAQSEYIQFPLGNINAYIVAFILSNLPS
jgi:ubiquinone/menaquinone biosynthesis C-methylase UbiE